MIGLRARLHSHHDGFRHTAPLPSYWKPEMHSLPPSILTPMERQLLHRVQTLAENLEAQSAEQDRKIASLEAEVRARDQAIRSLTATLGRLLGPRGQGASSPP